jgi:hypothetical protein
MLESRRLLATVAPKVGLNFESTDYLAANTIPPDLTGAVGNDDVITLTNNRFRRYDRYGALLQNISLDQFWTNAGINVVGTSYQPRAEYDPGNDRFYVCALDNAGDNNAFLFALSNSGSLADGWTGFRIDSDAGSGNRWAEFPLMGFDNDGVYISANMLDIPGGAVLGQEVNLLVLPKQDLFAFTPNINRKTLLEDVSTITGDYPVPIISIDSTEAGASFPPRLVSGSSISINFSTLGGTVFVPTMVSLSDVMVSPSNGFNDAHQPDGTQNLDAGGVRLRSHVYEQDQKYWIAQSIEGSSSNGAIRFAVIDTGLNLVQYQHLENASADYIYPSIAVNEDQDVAIGFTRTGPDAGEYPSANVLLGTTSGNTTTFSSPTLIHEGTASYHRNDITGSNRWGDWSQTVIDPKQSKSFWTFQEFAKSSSSWGTWVAKVGANGVLPGDLPLTKSSATGFAVPFGLTGECDDQLSYDAFIDSKGDVDSYYFGGDPAVGSNFTITVDDGASLLSNPCLVVYDADTGEMVAFDEDAGSGDSAMVNFNGASHKRYVLAVADEIGGTGDYVININYGNTAPGAVIDLGLYNNADFSINISSNVDPEFYRFTTPPDAVGSGSIYVTPPGGALDLAIWVFDAQGNRIKRDSAAAPGGGFDLQLTDLQPGQTYYITCFSEDYASSGTADARLWIEYVMGPLGITYTGPVDGQLVPSAANGIARDSYFGDVSINTANDIYAFWIVSEDVPSPGDFTIQANDATPFTDVNPVVAVYRENGTLVTWDNDSGAGFYDAELTFTPQPNRRYIVAVCAYFGLGDINVLWDRGTPQVTTIPVPSGAGFTNAVVPAHGTDFFKFTTPHFVSGTAEITFEPIGGTLDGALLITNGAGAKVASSRVNNPGENKVAWFAGLDGDTDYYITVTSFNYDTAGSGLLYVNFDIPTPLAPGAPDLVSASDSGASSTDNITSDNTPTFTGPTIIGATVHLYANNIEVGVDTTTAGGSWTITAPALPEGTISFTVKADVGGGLSPASSPLSVTIDRTAPTVQLSGLSFNSVFAAQVKFDEDVSPSLAPGDFVIVQAGTGTIAPNSVKTLTYNSTLNLASISFPTLANTVLPDGDYTVTVVGAAVEDLAGNSMAANHAFNFFFLQGDANRDRFVDTQDFNALAGNFGAANRTFSQGNFNYDTAVDSVDFNLLTGQYGKRLVAPAVAAPGLFASPPLTDEPAEWWM